MSYKDEIIFKLDKNEKIRITRRENRNLSKNLKRFCLTLSLFLMSLTFYTDGFDYLFLGTSLSCLLLSLILFKLTKKLVDLHVQQDSLLVKHRYKKNIIIYVNLVKEIETFQFLRLTLTRFSYKFDGNKYTFFVFKIVSAEKASPERMLRFIQAIQTPKNDSFEAKREIKASHKPGSVPPEQQECLSFI